MRLGQRHPLMPFQLKSGTPYQQILGQRNPGSFVTSGPGNLGIFLAFL